MQNRLMNRLTNYLETYFDDYQNETDLLEKLEDKGNYFYEQLRHYLKEKGYSEEEIEAVEEKMNVAYQLKIVNPEQCAQMLSECLNVQDSMIESDDEQYEMLIEYIPNMLIKHKKLWKIDFNVVP